MRERLSPWIGMRPLPLTGSLTCFEDSHGGVRRLPGSLFTDSSFPMATCRKIGYRLLLSRNIVGKVHISNLSTVQCKQTLRRTCVGFCTIFWITSVWLKDWKSEKVFDDEVFFLLIKNYLILALIPFIILNSIPKW